MRERRPNLEANSANCPQEALDRFKKQFSSQRGGRSVSNQLRTTSYGRPASQGTLGYYYNPQGTIEMTSQDDSSSISSSLSFSDVEFRLSEALRANAAFEDSCGQIKYENEQLKEELKVFEERAKSAELQIEALTAERECFTNKDSHTSSSLKNPKLVLDQIEKLQSFVHEARIQSEDPKVAELLNIVRQLRKHEVADHDENTEINFLTNEIDKLKRNLNKTEMEFNDYKEKVPSAEAYQEVINELKSSILTLSSQSQDTQSTSLSPSKTIPTQKYQKLKERSRDDCENLRNLTAKYNRLMKRKVSLKQENQRLQADLSQYDQIKEKNQCLTEELESLRTRYTAQYAKFGELERKTKYLTRIKGYNENINSLCSSSSYKQNNNKRYPDDPIASSSISNEHKKGYSSSEYSTYQEQNGTPLESYDVSSTQTAPAAVHAQVSNDKLIPDPSSSRSEHNDHKYK